jgi:hypothetical protein
MLKFMNKQEMFVKYQCPPSCKIEKGYTFAINYRINSSEQIISSNNQFKLKTRNICKTPPSCNIEKGYTLDYPLN